MADGEAYIENLEKETYFAVHGRETLRSIQFLKQK